MTWRRSALDTAPEEWEVERSEDAVLRWTCAACGLPNAEHPDQWFGCLARAVSDGLRRL